MLLNYDIIVIYLTAATHPTLPLLPEVSKLPDIYAFCSDIITFHQSLN
jgi:hypothetical protein